CDCHAFGCGTNDAVLRDEAQGLGRDILEFGGRRRAPLRKFVQCLRIDIVCCDVGVGDAPRGAVRARIEHQNLVAHALCRHCKHAAGRASAQEPKPCTWRDWHGYLTGGSCMAATAACCSRRNPASRFARASSSLASKETANNAALTAPASPIAKVATGTPRG